jgi:hypothetical protein
MLTWLNDATRKFPATFGAICMAIISGVLGGILVAAGASASPVGTVQTVIVQAASFEAHSTSHTSAWLHSWHVRHLLHLRHLRAMLAQELAAKQASHVQTLADDAQVPAAVQAQAQPQQHYAGSTAMQQCIIRAESGGNPQIWNASGHWGLYQFSYGTWTAHGGAAADFGRAGADEQTAVFWQTVRDDGYSDWTPYDGC